MNNSEAISSAIISRINKTRIKEKDSSRCRTSGRRTCDSVRDEWSLMRRAIAEIVCLVVCRCFNNSSNSSRVFSVHLCVCLSALLIPSPTELQSKLFQFDSIFPPHVNSTCTEPIIKSKNIFVTSQKRISFYSSFWFVVDFSPFYDLSRFVCVSIGAKHKFSLRVANVCCVFGTVWSWKISAPVFDHNHMRWNANKKSDSLQMSIGAAIRN